MGIHQTLGPHYPCKLECRASFVGFPLSSYHITRGRPSAWCCTAWATPPWLVSPLSQRTSPGLAITSPSLDSWGRYLQRSSRKMWIKEWGYSWKVRPQVSPGCHVEALRLLDLRCRVVFKYPRVWNTKQFRHVIIESKNELLNALFKISSVRVHFFFGSI